MASFPGIERAFSAGERERGLRYFREGRVRLLECRPAAVRAAVRGTHLYAVQIEEEKDNWRVDCTCPAFDDVTRCKHLWATFLAARERLDGIVTVTASHPTRSSEPRARGFPDPDDEVAAEVDDWDEALTELEHASRPDSPDPARLHARFVLHAPADRGTASHRFETIVGRPTTRGAIAYRSGAIRRQDLARFAAEDRAILARLLGGDVADAFVDRAQATAHWRLTPELQADLLPALAARGRLEFQARGKSATVRLGLDEGGAFELCLELKREQEEYVLGGRVVRGDAHFDLGSLDVVLEGGWFVAHGAIHAVDWRGAWRWMNTLRAREEIRIPSDERPRLLALLEGMPGRPLLEAEEFVTPVVVAPTGILQLAVEGLARDALGATIVFAYGAERVLHGAEPRLLRRQGRLVQVQRDEATERGLLEVLAGAGVAPGPAESPARTHVTTSALPKVVADLHGRGWVVEAEGHALHANPTTSVSIQSGIDWFDVTADVDYDGVHAELPELLRAIQERRRFVRLSDGSHGLLPERWLESWGLCEAIATAREESLRVPKSQGWLLDAWLSEQAHVDVDASFARLRTALAQRAQVTSRREPAGFRGELRPYQREGLGWLAFLSETGLGGCLADDMGLGKTVQVLALVLERRARSRGPALVVAPSSVLFNWKREAERFAPALDVLVHHGTTRARKPAKLEDVDLVVTSYGTLRQDVGWLAKVDLDCAILDEAQAIKNARSLTARAARALSADLRLAMTGTPVENHLGELFSIFSFLNPGLAKGSARLREALQGREGDVDTARILARGLRPFLLRRTKEQVLTDLPPKTEQVVACELESKEQREYVALRDHFRRELLARVDDVGLEQSGIHVLAALMRLRQAACHPGLIDPARVGETSAKIEALLPMLDEVRESGHRALVFSQFTSFLAIVRARLDEQGVAYEYLDGATRRREACVRRFQENPSVPFFLISLKAGGVGLNLTGADYVFLLDPWWNPAVEAQAIDRTHRIGQTRPVTAYRLIARGTVEEKVLELQDRKRALAEALFSDAGTSLADLTRADVEWLLS